MPSKEEQAYAIKAVFDEWKIAESEGIYDPEIRSRVLDCVSVILYQNPGYMDGPHMVRSQVKRAREEKVAREEKQAAAAGFSGVLLGFGI